MVLRHSLLLVMMVFCSCVMAMAQPSLPDITGQVQNNAILLSWVCQYSSVKKVAVLRSVDNMHDFEEIGTVSHTSKGAQFFIDNHPLPGKNCYKVAIVFKSGLKWQSNHFCTTLEKSALESLNRPNLIPDIKEGDNKQHTNQAVPIKPEARDTKTGDIPRAPFLKTAQVNEVQQQLPFKSKYLICNAQTGNLLLTLPFDVTSEKYSIRFFDNAGRYITEVPHINSAKLVFDSRNFQQKETIKFVLRKNGVVLEEGIINLNP